MVKLSTFDRISSAPQIPVESICDSPTDILCRPSVLPWADNTLRRHCLSPPLIEPTSERILIAVAPLRSLYQVLSSPTLSHNNRPVNSISATGSCQSTIGSLPSCHWPSDGQSVYFPFASSNRFVRSTRSKTPICLPRTIPSASITKLVGIARIKYKEAA